MARATFAPVIGSPASWSQKIVCRYSSSATVASAMRRIVSVGRGRLGEPAGQCLDAALGQRNELPGARREVRVAARHEGERLVEGRRERDRAEAAPPRA